MNDPQSSSQFLALLRDWAELMGQLQASEPADFGRIARRTNESAERLLELLWLGRDLFASYPASAFELDEPRGNFPAAPVAYCVHAWLDWAYERNQFFEFEVTQLQAIRGAHRILFRRVLLSLQSATDYAGFARHVHLAYLRFAERLTRVFRTLVAPEALRGRAAEYSAELQLQLLGLSNHGWREPIVDLGCGMDATLVRYLRELGLAATGVERRSQAPNVVAKDWFELRFDPNSIGTIISHLAFSLQFLHHHWHPGERAYKYAHKYMELLRSLVPGGLFCYAPGLPFIEQILDQSEYEVTQLPLPEPLASSIGTLRDIGTGQSVAYACQIRRRG